MAKTRFTSVRIALAFGVAAVADGLQFFTDLIARHWTLPGELADFVLDVIVSALLSLLMGFRLILLPSFIMKTIPSVEDIPTWTATVAFLVWSEKRQAKNQPQAADAAEAGDQPAPAPENPPSATLSAVTPPPTLKSPGLWYLVATVALLGGLILYYRHHENDKQGNKDKPGQNTTETRDRVTWPKGRPVVVVGQVEDQTALNSSQRNRQAIANPEKVRAELGEMLRNIDGVEVLEESQAQAFLNEWDRHPGGLSDEPSVTVVRATILDMQATVANVNAYGVAMKSLDIQCSLRLQVIRASDNTVTFSKTLTGSKTVTQTEEVQSSSTEDPTFAAVKATLKPVEKDTAFRNAVRGGKTGEQVEVEFSPKPDNCDIEIDGHYAGGSPLKLKLPAGRETLVRISKAGFKDWEGRLMPQAGLRVQRELEPVESNQPTP